jgi:hypothetical protein
VRIYAYVLNVDSGFAPNPFHGWCTLACCKPAIRRRARRGDWVVGITPRDQGNRIAYAMRVDESLTFEEYWSDPRFRAKRPGRVVGAPIVERCGDNCYEPLGAERFRQVRGSGHWDRDNDREHEGSKRKDLGGKRVLVGQRFCYYGADAVPFPEHLSFQRPARFHRVNISEGEKLSLLKFLEDLPQGIRGRPRNWPMDDGSWRQRAGRCG